MKTATIFRSFLLFVLATLSAPAMAAYPDITGTWSGTASLQDDFCSGGPLDSWTEQTELTFSNQSGATFNADLYSIDSIDGVTISASTTGSFSSISTLGPMTFSGTLSDGYPVVINITSASISGDTMTVNFTFDEYTPPPGSTLDCYGHGTATLTRASGSIVNPVAAPSNAVTSDATTLTQVVTTTTNALASRIQSALQGSIGGPRRVAQGFMMETTSGLAAGDTFNNIGAWVSYSYSSFDNDFSRTEYDGRRFMVFAGVDFAPRDDMVLGVAVGYEDTQIDTDFNLGELDADGWTIAPYFGMILNDTWNIDVSAGYSDIDTDQDRSNGAITSDVDTDRWFFAANINGFTQVNNWFLSGRAGLLNAESDDDDFTESNGTVVEKRSTLLTQFNIGGEAAYSMGEFEPFVSAYYNKDLHATETVLTAGAQPSNDNDDVLLGVGFRYYGKEGLSVSAQVDSRLGRSDIDEDTFTLNARWDF